MIYLFAVNPGSTSTKTGLFRDSTCLSEQTIRHSDCELQQGGGLKRQLSLRMHAVETILQADLLRQGLSRKDLAAYIGRGGLLHPLTGGTYLVNQAMLDDLADGRYGVHASNFGAQIASELAWPLGKPAYVVDPPVVDEMMMLARYTGLPEIRRRSVFHALNHKAVARRAAERIGRPYEELNLIIAHLGGGISVAAHDHGSVIDVNDAMEEGPFSPERAGSLPTLQLLQLFSDSGFDLAAMRRRLVGQGGLFAYTGLTDNRTIETMAARRSDYHQLLQAMAYQVAKFLASLTAAFSGPADAVVITGGLARNAFLIHEIRCRIHFTAEIMVFPGEYELAALAEGALRVLTAGEPALIYEKEA